MLAAGIPMAIASKMLRHSSIGITVDTYGHLSEYTARAAAAGDHSATTTADGAAEERALAPRETANAQVNGGGPRGDRTLNPRIKSPLLCQLS
jgi:hypothetical protein